MGNTAIDWKNFLPKIWVRVREYANMNPSKVDVLATMPPSTTLLPYRSKIPRCGEDLTVSFNAEHSIRGKTHFCSRKKWIEDKKTKQQKDSYDADKKGWFSEKLIISVFER